MVVTPKSKVCLGEYPQFKPNPRTITGSFAWHFDNSAAKGILHIGAAGNSGTTSGTENNVIFPARYDPVVAVAATDSSNNRASFSSTGPAVEMAAPGVSIRSTVPGGGYASYNGTSMASPHVAGVAALVIASGVTSSAEVRKTLQNTATDLGTTGRDTHFGFGLVNADLAAGGVIQPDTGSLTGTVSGNSVLLSGATVTLNSGASTKTDGNGAYSFTGIPTGTYIVTASASGFNSASGDASVSKGAVTTVNFNLTSSTTSEPDGLMQAGITRWSTSGGKAGTKDLHIEFAVTANSAAVAGASINVSFTNGGRTWKGSGSTSSTGVITFKIGNAPSGTYTATVNSLTASGLTWDGQQPSNSTFVN